MIMFFSPLIQKQKNVSCQKFVFENKWKKSPPGHRPLQSFFFSKYLSRRGIFRNIGGWAFSSSTKKQKNLRDIFVPVHPPTPYPTHPIKRAFSRYLLDSQFESVETFFQTTFLKILLYIGLFQNRVSKKPAKSDKNVSKTRFKIKIV